MFLKSKGTDECEYVANCGSHEVFVVGVVIVTALLGTR